MPQLNELYRPEQYIDAYAPGHYARVLEAEDLRRGGRIAFKVMRPEHLRADGEMRWEYRAFGNEADILVRLKASPHVVRLLDCGYIASDDEAPAEGEIETFGTDAAAFTAAMSGFAERGWRPYLALEMLARTDNLYYLMKPTQAGARWRLPSEEGLTLALQFANLMRIAHSQRIVYLDHKLEHLYWDGVTLRVIDFNSSRRLESGDPREYTRDVHHLCVGVLYPLFTGMAPQNTPLRPQPGNREDVENRYIEITELDFMMEPLLSRALQNLLRRGAAYQIEGIDPFIYELEKVAALHGRDFPQHYTSPASRQSRDQLRNGLKHLREGETSLRKARDLFREAAIQDGITEDLEDELRRLINGINEMLNRRVIP